MSKHEFVNKNPLGAFEKDCVCRAISNATNENYYTIQKKLDVIGFLFNCDSLCVDCYKHLLDYVYRFNRIEAYQGYAISDFLDDYPIGTFIIRVNGHLVCARNGKVEDTWNSQYEIIDIVWRVR